MARFVFFPWMGVRIAVVAMHCFGMGVAMAGAAPLSGSELAEQGVRAFQSQDFKWARESFETLQQREADHPLAAYYLGTLALREGQIDKAVAQWQRYVRLDPEGAEANGVPARLTLLEDESRKGEIAGILKNEARLSKMPAEPNSIAVMGFSNKGDEKYNVLAKGITALIITDLAQVPGLKVLEREKVQKLQDEIKLSESGLVADENKVKAGRLLRAEKIMMGDFTIQEAQP